jgi:MOSC domain-containing protein YiiM
MTGRVVQINRSNGGVPKLPVSDARVTASGLDGDKQRDRRFHGGPERAVCLYSLERIEALAAEGHSIAPGTLGENVTIGGIDWGALVRGTIVRLGEVELELTEFAAPCKTIRGAFVDEDFSRISNKRHPGWSRVCARVVRAGVIRRGDLVEVVGLLV